MKSKREIRTWNHLPSYWALFIFILSVSLVGCVNFFAENDVRHVIPNTGGGTSVTVDFNDNENKQLNELKDSIQLLEKEIKELSAKNDLESDIKIVSLYQVLEDLNLKLERLSP